ncbi:MAG: hypothetical protein IT373_33880 [Polyangiaceae bacterium]|nr:hypothetical protein [Polyangiaceae bacterium]
MSARDPRNGPDPRILGFSLGLGLAGCGAAAPPPPVGPLPAPPTAAPAPVPAPPDAREVPDPGGGPPRLTDEETAALRERCALLEAQSFAGVHDARVALEERYYADPRAEPDDAAALELAMKAVARAPDGLPAADHAACVPIYQKRFARLLWELEPAEDAARDAVKACQQAAASAHASSRPEDEEGAPLGAPFCRSARPVPAGLAALPFASTAADWDAPGWRCLGFRVRATQPFQLAYTSDAHGFACVARFEPRHGGPTVELRLGGELDRGGLMLDKQVVRRRIELLVP